MVVATTSLLNLRSSYGIDGSDQMTTQVFGALFLGFLPGTTRAQDAALWYIALQACLSYGTAGFVKVISPYWYRGDALFGIFNTRTYGHPAVARFLHGRPLVMGINSFFWSFLATYPAILYCAWLLRTGTILNL